MVETKWKCITKEQPYLLKEPSNEMNNSMYKGNTSIKVKLKGGGGTPGICGAFDFLEGFLVELPIVEPQNFVRSDQVSYT